MTIETDFAAALATLQTAVSGAVTDIQNLAAQIAGNSGDQTIIANATTALMTLATNLNNAVNPPVTPPVSGSATPVSTSSAPVSAK